MLLSWVRYAVQDGNNSPYYHKSLMKQLKNVANISNSSPKSFEIPPYIFMWLFYTCEKS